MKRRLKRVCSIVDLLLSAFKISGKSVADIGCGNGLLSFELANAGAKVTGVDRKRIISSINTERHKSVEFLEGTAEKLPLKNSAFDFLIYSASFHHVPVTGMNEALKEARRVLKNKGGAVFIEPVALEGTYYDLTKHFKDEKFIQVKAYNAIRNALNVGFKEISESYYYIFRTFADFESQINFFVKNKTRRKNILDKALMTMHYLFPNANESVSGLKIKSVFRLNVLEKIP